VSLKDEIEKMIQAEREKLESRDKKEQDAHLVIGLYNEAMEKAQDRWRKLAGDGLKKLAQEARKVLHSHKFEKRQSAY
jgi:hypothetical protein|tara:strand:+ start:2690 stop:2923 length:234 start_codon:yes stop_codon:yes gene_type:complete